MKVGDYVRTKSYGIKKINGFSSTLEEDFIDCDYDKYQKVLINKKEVIKSSPNIIDLIEVGDIVNYEQLNGGVVLNKKDDSIDTWSILPNSLKNEDIKSVITKEQLKNCMYEVGE